MYGTLGNLFSVMWPNQELVGNFQMLLLYCIFNLALKTQTHGINSNTRIIRSLILEFRVPTNRFLCVSVWDVTYLFLLWINIWTIYTWQDDSRISFKYLLFSSFCPYLFSDLAASISQNKIIFRHLRKNVLTWRTTPLSYSSWLWINTWKCEYKINVKYCKK